MITHVTGNILDTKLEAFICPVNCVGTMGAGLARQVKENLPSVEPNYRQWCSVGNPEPGGFIAVEAYDEEKAKNEGLIDLKYKVICLATKGHWRNPSELDWIEEGLTNVRKFCDDYEVKSIAIPHIGCGYGGLKWEDVLPMVEKAFADYEGTVHIYD